MSGRFTSRNWLETIQFGGLLEDRGKMAIEGLGGPKEVRPVKALNLATSSVTR